MRDQSEGVVRERSEEVAQAPDRVGPLSRPANNSERRRLRVFRFLYFRCGMRHANTQNK
jgi:hypothetical protein